MSGLFYDKVLSFDNVYPENLFMMLSTKTINQDEKSSFSTAHLYSTLWAGFVPCKNLVITQQLNIFNITLILDLNINKLYRPNIPV